MKQVRQVKAEEFLFPFLESKCSVRPKVFELQVRTWRNALNTDDGDANWLAGTGYWLERQNRINRQTKTHMSIAQNLLNRAPG